MGGAVWLVGGGRWVVGGRTWRRFYSFWPHHMCTFRSRSALLCSLLYRSAKRAKVNWKLESNHQKEHILPRSLPPDHPTPRRRLRSLTLVTVFRTGTEKAGQKTECIREGSSSSEDATRRKDNSQLE